MSINLKPHKEQLLFLPLGGANEIGINVNLYHYAGKWIMIDCGSGFAEDNLPGVDMIVADLSFIEARKKDLLGLVLTHAHEDHLGAIQYLWRSLECPIYTTRFTRSFLKSKLSEYEFAHEVQIIEVASRERFTLGPFSIEMIGLTHSAPEMHALMIRTAAGNILHTGDWKFDPKPVIGQLSDEAALKECGNEGVLALVCDSTNVFNHGVSGSEGDVRDSIVDIIAGCPQMVVVTTFASNLARMDTIIHAGQRAGRKICLTGRSLHKIYNAAKDSGYFEDIQLLDDRSISKYKRKEILVIATGCQGEPLAATTKIVTGQHPSLTLAPGDTVIFSSRIIPGNEKKIFKLFNSFVKKGIEVITERDHFVHVSGHPAIDELKRMYDLVRPTICIPVHGEPIHIHEHVKLAKNHPIKHVIEVQNGSIVLLEQESPKIIHEIGSSYLAVDGNYLLPDDAQIFHMRRKMRDSGIVIVSVVLDKRSHLVTKPMLTTPGVFDPVEDQEFLQAIEQAIVEEMNNRQRTQSRHYADSEQIKESLKRLIRRMIKTEINKSPIVIVNIGRVH